MYFLFILSLLNKWKQIHLYVILVTCWSMTCPEKNYLATRLFLTVTNILYNKRVVLELLERSFLIDCRKQWQVPNKGSPIPVVNVWMSITIIYHKHKCKKGITQLALTSQRRADRCDLEFLKYYIWSGCYILLLKSTFFSGGGGWEEEVNYNMDRSCFPRHTAQVTLLTPPSFGTVKYIINLQYN